MGVLPSCTGDIILSEGLPGCDGAVRPLHLAPLSREQDSSGNSYIYLFYI